MSDFTADALLRLARNALLEAGIVGAKEDAFLLFSEATGLSRLDLLKDPTHPIKAEAYNHLQSMLSERIEGKPVGRILGKRDVLDIEFKLNAETLEPRDDTVALIEAVMPFVQETIARQNDCRILDMGTGAGLIALSLLKCFDRATAIGADISERALEAAFLNAQNNGLDGRFQGFLSDGFSAVDGMFDLIISNPPYIRSDVIANLSIEVRDHDPHIALDGGADGLAFYRLMATQARSFLQSHGMVAVEIGYDQKDDVIALFKACDWQLVSTHQDLSGNDRALLFA